MMKIAEKVGMKLEGTMGDKERKILEVDEELNLEVLKILVKGKKRQLIPMALITLEPILSLVRHLIEHDTNNLTLTIILSIITTSYFLYCWRSYRKDLNWYKVIKQRLIEEKGTKESPLQTDF